MKPEFAQKLINKTIADYNKIAPLWSSKRSHLPSDIIELKKYIQTDDRILDLGCANGYLIELFENISNYIGVDVSDELINIAKTKYPEGNFIHIEPNQIPFPDASFDKVFCLSTIHHIPGEEERLKFMAEINRVLKPNGLLILTAWDTNSEMFAWWQKNKASFAEYDEMDTSDILYPFKNGDGEAEINRYLHCFTSDELQGLLQNSSFEVEAISTISRNKGKFGNILTISHKK
ncbi:MAG: class I SAM-dependent methyltransferase [bacterium]